jgi:hypothetical protein
VRPIAYLTDVEGRWDKIVDFCEGNSLVSLERDDRLVVADGALFVFGGDAVDRGPQGQRIVRALTEAKRAAPDRVVLLAGNRDINKMRLARELDGHPPERVARELSGGTRADLLRLIFARTMGAKEAFGHRQVELLTSGTPASDEDVVKSFLQDVATDGELTAYLSLLALAHREGDTLFVHGAVTGENLFTTPDKPREDTVDGWVRSLNDFYTKSVRAFTTRSLGSDGTPAWADLVAYQAPIPGTRRNPSSVVYARPATEAGDPVLPPPDVVAKLREGGIERLVVGHTPCGDCPAVLRYRGFEMVLADNSYARWERGSRVILAGETTTVHAFTELDGGEREELSYSLSRGEESPIGLRDEESGRLVKAPLECGFLTFRALPSYGVEQRRVSADDVRRLRLVRAS